MLFLFVLLQGTGWQKLPEGEQGHRQKVWIRTQILSPTIRDIKICRDLRTVWETLGKKSAFGAKTSVS